jgi:hypothetical protein
MPFVDFEYLIKLNVFASRLFRIASIYPMFAWVLSDFGYFDLADTKSFRDLHFSLSDPCPDRAPAL